MSSEVSRFSKTINENNLNSFLATWDFNLIFLILLFSGKEILLSFSEQA